MVPFKPKATATVNFDRLTKVVLDTVEAWPVAPSDLL